MTSIIKYYNWLFHDLGDPRVKNWPLMSGPMANFGITLFYLYSIKIILPTWMKNKAAYNLKNVITAYNTFQIIANSIIFYGMLTSGWFSYLHLGCTMPDYSNDPLALRQAYLMYAFYIMKVIELVETVFFILRKKDNQASFLHVYHHCVTMFLMWMGAKYYGGGMTLFPTTINSFTHVIMYSYYLASTISGPKLRSKLNKWKSWLTIMQMTQFTIAIVHGSQVLLPSCPAPSFLFWIYIPNVLIVYYLFWDFYKNTYKKKKHE